MTAPNCTNHYSDGSKIFPGRDCCKTAPSPELKPWYYEYDNDTGDNDDYYVEFYSIFDANHEKIGQVDDLESARLVCETVNTIASLRTTNERYRRALEEILDKDTSRWKGTNDFHIGFLGKLADKALRPESGGGEPAMVDEEDVTP